MPEPTPAAWDTRYASPPYGIFDDSTRTHELSSILYNQNNSPDLRPDGKFGVKSLPQSGHTSLISLYSDSVKQYPNDNCAGYRELLNIHWEEDKKVG